LKLVVHGKTDKGLVRKENEDAFCIEKDLGLLAIADGMISHGDRFQGPAGDSGANQ
jgi:serine/threonine protein phosphatase PrpC